MSYSSAKNIRYCVVSKLCFSNSKPDTAGVTTRQLEDDNNSFQYHT